MEHPSLPNNALPPEAQDAVYGKRWLGTEHGSCRVLWLAHLHGSVRAADPHLGNTQNKALTQEHDL